MSQQFPNVWYATPVRVASRAKFKAHDDCGRLEISSSELTFLGAKQRLQMRDIRTVALTRQNLPWLMYLVVNVLMSPCCALTAYLIYQDWSERTEFSVQIALVSLVVIYLVSNVLVTLINVNTSWVLVEYADMDNQTQQAYFMDASGFGWGGFLGGTRRMYQAILPRSR